MKGFVWRRSLAVAKKELFHILRDPFTLGAAIGLPLFMVIVFGLAIEFNVKYIVMAVSDSDKTQSSRQLLDTFSSSQYFTVTNVDSPQAAIDNLISEKSRTVLVIPPDFQRDLYAGRTANVQILLDGSDSSTVVPVLGYINTIQKMASSKIANFDAKEPYELRTRYLFNPELNSRWFIVPGIGVVIMAILFILLTSLTVAREYENGSMELLLSTPIRPIEIIIGKLAPYGVLGAIVLFVIYLISRYVFFVPFVGNHAVFAFGAILFAVAYLAQGLLISVKTRNQQVALQLAMMTGMLPTQLLSGFIFPLENMPKFFQYLTVILPARWYIQISRDSYLEGTNFIHLWVPFLALSIFCVVMIYWGVKSFKSDLEP